MAVGQLISRSCTTGWLDRHHGDLFLTPEALIRVRLPEPTVEGRRMRATVGPQVLHEVPGLAEADRLRSADTTNRYLLLARLSSARLHRGIVSDRLLVATQDGEHHKFLWLKVDPAYEVLRRDLPRFLGSAFSIA